MKFRVETGAGHRHDLEADDLQAAIEAVEECGHRLDQIISVWYFNTIYGQWQSADNLLAAYREAKKDELDEQT